MARTAGHPDELLLDTLDELEARIAALERGAQTVPSFPWLVDVDVFPTASANTNWDSIWADSANIGGGQKESSGAQNDEINWDVILGAGTWALELFHNGFTDRGFYTVQIDGVTLGTIDGYRAATTYNIRSTISGIAVAQAGKKRLKLKMATRNLPSSGYRGSINALRMRRTA